jgi:hypothetical protein
MNKKAKEQPKKIEKTYYDVKVEALVPTLLVYRVFAEDENKALEQIKRLQPTSVKPLLHLKRLIKAAVHLASSSTIKLTKTFRI